MPGGTPPLQVDHPESFLPERRYALEFLFREQMGLAAEFHARAGLRATEITRAGTSSMVTIAEGLFAQGERGWPRDLPPYPDPEARVPVQQTDLAARLIEPWIPRMWGPETAQAVRECDGSTWIDVDLLGTTFALLAGLEERYPTARDQHGRLRAADSLPGRGGFLDRPLVDELATLLAAVLTRRWPDLQVRFRRPGVVATHDVDRPYGTWGHPVREVLGFLKGDLLQRRSPALAISRAASLVKTHMFGPQADFHQNFGFLMDVSDDLGLTSTFLFIDRRGDGFGEPRYDLDDPHIAKVIQDIDRRGHRIGLHGSYSSYDDADRLTQERVHLQGVIEGQGIAAPVRLGRQHYLRFQNPETWRAAVAAGLEQDTTFGFADRPGFRAGTARPYPVFDLAARKRLPLTELPLVFMEGSCFQYLGYGWTETRRLAEKLAARAFRYGGDFVFLWHPSMVNTPRRRRQYRRLVRGLVRRAAAAAETPAG